MRIPSNGKLLRIFVDETDRFQGQPLYEAIVLKARQLGMGGATVLKGIMGFGLRSLMHHSNILKISENAPIVIEIVDSEENTEKFIKLMDEMVREGLVTVETVNVVKYQVKPS